ncbi:50S ribosomal L33 [Chlorella sorokiniana]|uniref:50S ribosomal L33 n=1 Tax=Chlorella sorokiniana TaxID=3076 RepID=A0A2P6TWZ3_CHLSO|nr:50S ribosomal L33 [Chlorella sorokiniana]|eukprot:PRW58583.1 50S ribosomal L33 [Chlorella sorokiniana]
MAGGKKAATVLVKLLSTAGTGYFYVARKNPRKLPKKLEFVKYDPRVQRHVLFTETKLK